MGRLWLAALTLSLFLAACDSAEDRAVKAFHECTVEYGVDTKGGALGITRGPGDNLAVVLPSLPEPAATECLRRVEAVLRGD